MTDQELDALMKKVLLDAIQTEEDSSCSEAAAFEASPKYQRQMRLMLADPLRWVRKRSRPVWKVIAQRAAVLFLIFSLEFVCLNPAARAAVSRWIAERYDTYIDYIYTGDDRPSEMPRYEITTLPEGYVEFERCELGLGTMVNIEYEHSGDRNRITLGYSYMRQGGGAVFHVEDTTMEPVLINGMKGELYLYENSEDLSTHRNAVIWVDSDENIQFDLHGSFGKSDILRMAESVSLAKIPEIPQYEVKNLPEGYFRAERWELQKTSVRITYMSGDDECLQLSYAPVQQGKTLFTVPEGVTVEEVSIHGKRGELYQDGDQRSAVSWLDPKRNMEFSLSGPFGKSDILHIAESVSLVKTPKSRNS